MKKLNPESQKKVDEYIAKLIEEQEKMERLVSHNLDYVFIQELIDRVENNDVIIEVTLKSGETLKMYKDKNKVATSSIGRTR